MTQTVKDVMTTDPLTASPGTTVADAARLMKKHDVGAIVVEEDGEVRGIVTDRDIVVRAVAEQKPPDSTRVADVVSGDVHTVSPDEPLERAIEQMRRRSVRRLPVVEGGKAVGILSLGDLAIERDESSALADISAAPSNS